jgi:uncharacterized protein
MPEAVFHRLDHPAVIRGLREYAVGQLGARPEVARVILIGSLARGDWSARSDADMVVIADEAVPRAHDRGVAYAPRAPLPVPVDLLVFTADESGQWGDRFRREVESGKCSTGARRAARSQAPGV